MRRWITVSLITCILFFTNCSKEDEFTKVIPEINACKWLNDSPCFLNLSFDDTQIVHYEIANLLNEYGFKGTFYLHSKALTNELIDKYNYIVQSGHEIGNHTANHTDLTKLSENEILHEIDSCTTILNSCFSINCTSFAHPYQSTNADINNLIFSQNLFTRNYSEYYTSPRSRFDITSESKINDLIKFIDEQIINNSCCLITGHGFDNMGWSPCTREFLIELLNYVEKVQNTNKVWVTTMNNGALYESLFYEVKLISKIDWSHHQIKIQLDCPNNSIYNNFSNLFYSIKIGKIPFHSIRSYGIEYIESETHYIFTIDLKQTKELTLRYDITGE